MLKQSFKMKKVLAILVAVLFVVSLTAVTASAHHIKLGDEAYRNYQTYYTEELPGHITTTDAPAYWHDNIPVFRDPPSGANTGTIEILNRGESPGSPEGSTSA
jgi:hypothetical protein